MNKWKEYWNNKHPKQDIIYAGRAIRGYKDRINVDVRNMIWADDNILERISGHIQGTNDQKARWCQKFVVSQIKYVGDKKKANIAECWQFPNETLITKTGDCEDGAILMASLMLNAGIPEWRVRVTAGLVKAGKAAETGGHAYVTYCRETDNNWVVLDWCYLQDSKVEVKDKPLMKAKVEYKDIWFSFNNLYSWAHKQFGVINGIK
jgi:predicted transglutaminase-like cysteine proteinase